MEFRNPKTIWKDPRSAIVDFGRVFGIGLFIIGSLIQWAHADWQFSWSSFLANSEHSFIWWFVGGVTLSLSTIVPWIIRPIYFLWMLFGQTMGYLVNQVILGLTFYLLFAPVGLLYRRWCGVITKRFDEKKDTYWEEKNIPKNKNYYYQQF